MDAGTIITTHGQCLKSEYSSPDRFGFHYNPGFENKLTYALRLLVALQDVRRNIYSEEADDSRIGHTPPETYARYDSEEHNKTRRWMEMIVPPTPKGTPPVAQQPKDAPVKLSKRPLSGAHAPKRPAFPPLVPVPPQRTNQTSQTNTSAIQKSSQQQKKSSMSATWREEELAQLEAYEQLLEEVAALEEGRGVEK